MIQARFSCSLLFLTIATASLVACSGASGGSGSAAPDSTTDVSTDATGDADPAETADSPGPGDPANYATEFRVVRVDASMSVAEQLSVHACAGLYNRQLGGSVFVKTDEDVPQANIDGALVRDEIWLDLLDLHPTGTVGGIPFLQECLEAFAGCVRYSYATQHELLPAILTVAAAEGVPLLADESSVRCDEPVVDATAVFADRTSQLLATEYVYENYLDHTTGLAMLNPGYDRFAWDLAAPDLVDDMPVALIDLVFSRRLFIVFLINGCTEDHPEQDLLGQIVNESRWPKPLGVFGYNDSWLVGGYLHEAQTRCLPSANMGAIPTRTTNLSFFETRRPAIAKPDELPRTAPETLTYDPAMTYVAFVIGDGDNIRYIMSTRRDWLEQRLERCSDASPACPPLTWTISPHLTDLAPDVLHWYYSAASATGADHFMLPPSGYQYAYPSGLAPDAQAGFAVATEEAARMLWTRSVVHWEWLDGWENAVTEFLPRYARPGGQIQGIFPVNVPFVFEAFPNWPATKNYEVIDGNDGGQIVLFRSRSWRGIDDRDPFHPSPQNMADSLAALPPGTVTWMYMTSDGGLTLDNSYAALAELLPDHVQLVSADAAADLALQASGN